MTTELPQSLRPIGHLVKIGNEYVTRDVVIYYWCIYKAVQEGMKLDKQSPDALKFLTSSLSILEKVKKENPGVEALTQDVVAQAHVEDQAQRLFNYAEAQDKAGIFNMKVVKAFYTSGYLFEVLSVFTEPDENIQSARKYAKWRATYIHNCLKTGETPVPGNQSMAAANDTEESAQYTVTDVTTDMQSFGFGSAAEQLTHNSLGYFPDPPSAPFKNSTGGSAQYGFGGPIGGGSAGNNYEVPSNSGYPPFQKPVDSQPVPPPRGGGYSPALSNTAPQQQGGFTPPIVSQPAKSLGLEDISEARKFTKYALSALDYDDAKTAILNMQKALAILQKT